MSKTFDPTKPVRTRDGRPARIVCTDVRQSGYPIFALIGNFEAESEYYTREGKSPKHKYVPGSWDLVNVPEKHVRWVNFYNSLHGIISSGPWRTGFATRDEADKAAYPDRIACIRIEFEEGDGL